MSFQIPVKTVLALLNRLDNGTPIRKKEYSLKMYDPAVNSFVDYRSEGADMERVLLLLHGTFSSVRGGFNSWTSAILPELKDRYSLILAFDHPTLVSIEENYAHLVSLLNPKQVNDLVIVGKSRGGLLGRYIVYRGEYAVKAGRGGLHCIQNTVFGSPWADIGRVYFRDQVYAQMLEKYRRRFNIWGLFGPVASAEAKVIKAALIDIVKQLTMPKKTRFILINLIKINGVAIDHIFSQPGIKQQAANSSLHTELIKARVPASVSNTKYRGGEDFGQVAESLENVVLHLARHLASLKIDLFKGRLRLPASWFVNPKNLAILLEGILKNDFPFLKEHIFYQAGNTDLVISGSYGRGIALHGFAKIEVVNDSNYFRFAVNVSDNEGNPAQA